jgi:hypothetical protein
MYLNFNKQHSRRPPKFVNVNVSGFTKSVYELEKDTGLIIDCSDILKEITCCIKDKMCAQVELEMYGLSLMESQCHSDRDEEVNKIIRLFINTGNLVYQECLDHGLYDGNTLGFVFSNCVKDNLVFIERTSMVEILRDEFNTVTTRYPMFVQVSW